MTDDERLAGDFFDLLEDIQRHVRRLREAGEGEAAESWDDCLSYMKSAERYLPSGVSSVTGGTRSELASLAREYERMEADASSQPGPAAAGYRKRAALAERIRAVLRTRGEL